MKRKLSFFTMLFLFLICLPIVADINKQSVKYSISNITPLALEKNVRAFCEANVDNIVLTENNFLTLQGENILVLKKGILNTGRGTYMYSLHVMYYLSDVDAIINFSIPLKVKETHIKLSSYRKTFNKTDENIITSDNISSNFTNFNTYKMTDEMNAIKESFEKNILKNLNIKWKYNSPSALEKFISF